MVELEAWKPIEMNLILKIFAAMALLAVAGFCAFGFLASYELAAAAGLPWRIGYGVVGTGCILVLVLLCLPRRKGR